MISRLHASAATSLLVLFSLALAATSLTAAVSDSLGRAREISRTLATLPSGRYILDHGAYSVAADTTVPIGVVLDIRPGSSLAPDAGVTVTFRGSIERNVSTRIFTGSGKVVGLRFNRPEWWGARATYGYAAGRDDAPALNAAIASAVASTGLNDWGRPEVFLSGYYYACEEIGAYVNPSTALDIEGTGGAPQAGGIMTCPTFKPTSYPGGTSGGVLVIHGIADSGSSIVDIRIHALSINNTAGSGAQAGLVINPEGAGHQLTGSLQQQDIEDVFVGGFATGWVVNNARQLHIARSSAWNQVSANSLGFLGQALGVGGFVGDMDFDDFQTVTCSGNNAAHCTHTGAMTFTANGKGTNFAGIRILGIFYASNDGLTLTASGGGWGADIWVKSGTQFDGFFCRAIKATSFGKDRDGQASLIADIHVDHVYHTGGPPQSCPAAHEFAARDGARMTGIVDDDNWFSGISNPAVIFENVLGCHANGEVITNAFDTTTAIRIADGTTSCAATGNTLAGAQTSGGGAVLASLVQVDAKTDYITVSGNVGSGVVANVVDRSKGTHNVIGDDGAAYIAFSPQVSCKSGRFAAGGAVGRYKKLGGKTATFGLNLSAVGIGSCMGPIQSSLPLPPNHSNTFLGADDVVGTVPVFAMNKGDSPLISIFASGSQPVLQSGSSIWISGTYELQ